MKRIIILAAFLAAFILPQAALPQNADASCWANPGIARGENGVVAGRGTLTCTGDNVKNVHSQLQLYEGREWRAITELYQAGPVWWDREYTLYVNWWCWTGTWRVVIAWDNISRSTFGNVVIGYPSWVGGC